MAEPTLTPGAVAIAAIRPELAPETCERLALAVLMASTTVTFDDDNEPHVCWAETACEFMAQNDPRLNPKRRADA